MFRYCFLLFFSFFFSGLEAQTQCNREIFRGEMTAWSKTRYFSFALERSFGPMSFYLSLGGGKLGYDRQYLSPEESNSIDERGRVNNSQTISIDYKKIAKGSYLEQTETFYSGPVVHLGISHYFTHWRRCDDRLRGLYLNLDALGIYTTEKQTVTYKSRTSENRYSQSGVNRFFTVGGGIGLGYQFYPLKNHLAVNMKLSHPFYIPLTNEINLSSPFAASRFEMNIGIGWRIGTY